LRRAVAKAPDNLTFRVMLARALIDSGKAAEAVETALPPGGSSPPELALWHARAEAAVAVRAWDIAAEAWKALCVAVGSEWRAWSGYGNALAELGRWAEASSAFKRAVELNPHELLRRRTLSAALVRAGQYDDGASELERCAEMAPSDPRIRISFARLLADLGRQE